MSKRPHEAGGRDESAKRARVEEEKVDLTGISTKILDLYTIVRQVGDGTYGSVFEGRDKANGDRVALKLIKYRPDSEGVPITTIREIKFLKELRHKNIINLRAVIGNRSASGEEGMAMIMDFMECDLTGVLQHHLRQKTYLSPVTVKSYMQQLLEVFEFMHDQRVLHRDVKAANILLSKDNVIKVADFGLARRMPRSGPMTPTVVTLWYKPPELIYGESHYTAAVDMWSLGCIFGEMLTNVALFKGETDLDQGLRIFTLCGLPTSQVWPTFTNLKHASTAPTEILKPLSFSEYFRGCNSDALDLLTKLLCLDPSRRISASDALCHPYFFKDPLPLPADQLRPLDLGDIGHEFECKQDHDRQKKLRAEAHVAGASSPTRDGRGHSRDSRSDHGRGGDGRSTSRSRETSTRPHDHTAPGDRRHPSWSGPGGSHRDSRDFGRPRVDSNQSRDRDRPHHGHASHDSRHHGRFDGPRTGGGAPHRDGDERRGDLGGGRPGGDDRRHDGGRGYSGYSGRR